MCTVPANSKQLNNNHLAHALALRIRQNDEPSANRERERTARRDRAKLLAMTVLEWLLDSDPAIRWQVLRDLVDAPAEVVAAERARVATEGWGDRLLALQGEDGQWEGGALFPARRGGSHDSARSGDDE